MQNLFNRTFIPFSVITADQWLGSLGNPVKNAFSNIGNIRDDRKYRDSVRAAIPESAPSARVRHISNDKPS